MKKLLRKILPNNLKEQARMLRDFINYTMIVFFSKSKFLSSIYYSLFDNSFHRQHQAVLEGRIKYQQSLVKIEESCTLLRRNIHRLEKGLIMKPRRDVFATGFIAETVDAFQVAAKQNALSGHEGKWFKDVLNEYFSIVGDDHVINLAKRQYSNICEQYNFDNDSKKSIPYKYSEIVRSNISFDELGTLFKQRRSVRWYKDESVDIKLINKAINIANQAPSACNRQPFKFYTVINKQLVKQVADCAMGTVGFSHNLPIIIAVVGDLSAFPAERDRNVIYIDGSLITMQLMLALETLGLSTCAINWPDIEERDNMLSELLELPKYERTIMLLAVGHADPDGGIPYSQKKDSSNLVKVIK